MGVTTPARPAPLRLRNGLLDPQGFRDCGSNFHYEPETATVLGTGGEPSGRFVPHRPQDHGWPGSRVTSFAYVKRVTVHVVRLLEYMAQFSQAVRSH